MSEMHIPEGLPYTRENLGKRCPQYGGVLTDLNDLPAGTTFHVCNGLWDGKIVVMNSQRHVSVIGHGTHPLQGEHIMALSGVRRPKNDE